MENLTGDVLTMSENNQQETLQFETEVAQLLKLVTHSLYSNKEIFLRELISNASDAADKLRFEALSDSDLFEGDSELKIWVDIDDKAKTVTIRDNGIGMSREEVIKNIGTIAKSGTRDFIESLGKSEAKDRNLIGQFGVGFYSAFVVADKVTVKTRRAGLVANQGVCWESSGEGNYTIENIDMSSRGTEITLHIKDDEKEFLDGMRLRTIIRKYSDHILLPIIMMKAPLPGDDKEEEKAPEEEVVNRATALWTMPKSKVKEEEYKELYKHIAHDFEDPMLWGHNRVEGKLEYISLLYIPSRAPFDLWNREHQRGLKLYVKRVFVMDDAEQLLPMYLRFVRGIVDSSDLPLNVSREILQSNKVIDSIRSGCVKRVLSMLEDLAEKDKDKYQKFWDQFGQVIKEGPAEDYANKDRIAKLLRFASTESDLQNVSLDNYVSRMKDGQEAIYYVTADSLAAAKNSPHLEIFKKKGIEVLLLSDRIDEWLTAHMQEFDGKKLQSVTKGDLDLSKLDGEEEKASEEEKKQQETDFDSVLKQVKEILGERIKEARLTHRLTDSPACLVAEENEMGMHLQRMLEQAGQEVPMVKPILELNPDHPIVVSLRDEQDDAQFGEWTHLLFEQAMLAEGGKLQDPGAFVKRLNKFLLKVQ